MRALVLTKDLGYHAPDQSALAIIIPGPALVSDPPVAIFLTTSNPGLIAIRLQQREQQSSAVRHFQKQPRM